MRIGTSFLSTLGTAFMVGSAFAAHWQLPGWQGRAVVEVAADRADDNVSADVAGVKVLCEGRAQPDGSDYRVMDANGKAVPFRVMWHDASRYSLILFEAKAAGQPYYVYFQNPVAKAETSDWQPHCGLILETMQRPAGKNPDTFEEMQALMAGSREKYGARWQRRIADGFNPFGPSDYYISVYRGWLNVPQTGPYEFCNASNEASFSFIDGKPLVHWPGRHTEERGARGEKHATVELTAGLHRIEYYHEEVTLQQMAFLGWRAPGMGRCWSIPEAAWTTPRPAKVTRYESRQSEWPVFEPVVVDSIWPVDRSDAQYTRVRFAANQPGPWQFGDGQIASGQDVAHVYLTTGRYDVVFQDVHWPLEVYEIEQVNDQQPAGKPAEYRELVRGYDGAKLPAPAAVEWRAMLATAPDDFAWLAEHESLPERTLHWLTQLIRKQPAQANAHLARAEALAKRASKNEAVWQAWREVLLATGDAKLWGGETAAAADFFRRAESVTSVPIPFSVRAARVGSYPYTLSELLKAKKFGEAEEVLDRWEETFPLEKTKGHSLFWRGKVAAERGERQAAVRYLTKALQLAPGASWEEEAERLVKELEK